MNARLSVTSTTCPYCGVGCGVSAETSDSSILTVRGDATHPANAGRLCVKGSALAETQVSGGRLLHPLIEGQRVSWDAALDHLAEGFRETVRLHGPDSIAFYLSGQLLTEDYYVANKLLKGFIGSANLDTNSRLCMASAVAAHKRAFGEDVVPCDYTDLDSSDLIVLVGSNTAWTHPILYQRIAARHPKPKIVVIDPRRTATCEIADLHLAIRPGSDAALFNALLCRIAESDALDENFVRGHTSGFEAAVESAREDADKVLERTGLQPGQWDRFCDWFLSSRAVVSLFSQGINQASNGTDKAGSIINCHLASGQIGRPGCGPFSITGQPNAMGGREVGGLANQLAAHRDFESEDLEAVGRFWDAPRLIRGPGLKAVDMFNAVSRGEIRAIWIMGTNPVVSLPGASRVCDALEACPLVVVSDCMADTETTRYANVLLPALSWGEKDGTVTNSERCISRQRALVPPIGEAKADWWIISKVAARMGHERAFDFRGPHQIFSEHARLSSLNQGTRRQFDLSALGEISEEAYQGMAPTRWPLDGRRPFADGRFSTPDGRARFVSVQPHIPRQQAGPRYPLILNTGRLRDQWHTMTRTGLAPRLFGHTDTPRVAINGLDASTLGIASDDLVEVYNEQGFTRGLALITDEVLPGSLFVPMHWSATFAWPTRINDLLDQVTDLHSGQPESKHGAVALRRVQVNVWMRISSIDVLDIDGSAQSLFWVRTPVPGGWRCDVALESFEAASELLTCIADSAELTDLICYRDPAHGDWRWLGEDERGDAVRLIVHAASARERLPDFSGLVNALQETPGWRLLCGIDPNQPARSRAVCACLEVHEQDIVDAINVGVNTVRQLGEQLGCGTNCGSCIPELRSLIRGAAASLNH